MSDSPDQTASSDVTGAALSTQRERLLEHRLVSDLAELMLRRGIEMDVLRGEFDGHGHDVVFQAAGVIRHVQLKAMILGGKRSKVSINVRLRSQPSGCVVWMPVISCAIGLRDGNSRSLKMAALRPNPVIPKPKVQSCKPPVGYAVRACYAGGPATARSGWLPALRLLERHAVKPTFHGNICSRRPSVLHAINGSD